MRPLPHRMSAVDAPPGGRSDAGMSADPTPRAPSARQRAAAIGAMVSLALVILLTILSISDDVQRALSSLPVLLIAIAAAWYAVTRRGIRKTAGFLVLLLAIVGLVVVATSGGTRAIVLLVVRIALLALAIGLARIALGRDLASLKAAPVPGDPVQAAARGVLMINPRSGDGKAARANLEAEARARGIEPVVLPEGGDLAEMVRAAIDDGADVIGMAGGDGSQALVADIAAERDVPMVVVPAGTRNHLAMDLGLDRNDVVEALDAFGDAVERRLDLGDVNGHVFVNNVSLGLYAEIVRSPAYREAKADTAIETLQEALAPGAHPYDLRFTDDEGRVHETAHLIQISNGPYGDGSTSRPALDTGRLGIMTLEVDDDRSAARLVQAFATKDPARFDGFHAWTAPTFEVTSEGPIDVGLDGEAMTMEPPLRFSIGRQVRVRIPHTAPGYSPAGRAIGGREAVRGVVAVALGHPFRPQEATQ